MGCLRCAHMHPSVGSHTSYFVKVLKCTDGLSRLDFIKQKAVWPHLSAGVLAREEGHYQLASSCRLQVLHGTMWRGIRMLEEGSGPPCHDSVCGKCQMLKS